MTNKAIAYTGTSVTPPPPHLAVWSSGTFQAELRTLRSASENLLSVSCTCETLTTLRRHRKSHIFHSSFATAYRPISAPLIRERLRRFLNLFTYLLTYLLSAP